jgi:acetyltransferase-like isoleucine patch superfamily enzyme
MTKPIRGLGIAWRALRFRLWTIRLRLALLRRGVRLRVDAPWRVDFRGSPGLRVTTGDAGPGALAIRLGRDVRVERDVLLEIVTGTAGELDLADRAELRAGVGVWLMGGSIRIGTGTIIRERAILKSGGELVIGDYVRFGCGGVIHCHERVELGSRAGLADLIVIVDSDHLHDGSSTWVMDQPVESAPIVVGANTLVGASVVLTRGAVIGPNSIVAAGAVVRAGEHPGGWVLGGVPARPLRELGDQDAVAAPA